MASADRLIQIFDKAKETTSGAERDRYLSDICEGESDLKEQILSLLEAHEHAGDFLRNTASTLDGATEKPGDMVGRYKLAQKIGEGGCGVVYMAEQVEPVRRSVAFKIIKPGMDTRSVVARFEAERQALALMDHPNIAKVFDAGTTHTGRPFFVMELVPGVRVTDFCDDAKLSITERLGLFITICHAVQHAHQKGIIHRDIKPSNILVAMGETRPQGQPKIIDFGIAKATRGERLTDKTVFTVLEQFIGTPAYMSPEQAQASGMDIDTRSDIYSLGVLLYELLTGGTPFDAQELLAAGPDEIRRRIGEEEPLRPSVRLNTLRQEDLARVAKTRKEAGARMIQRLRGDLDCIVMECLEKDRSRRYETANALALDLERHLNSEPIAARPPSNLYRFQKLLHRHKLAVASASAIFAALLIGLTISTWMFFEEKKARQRALAAEQAERVSREQAEISQRTSQLEAAKAAAVSEFLDQLLRSADPHALKGSTYSVRQLLDDFSARMGDQFKDQPDIEGSARATVGRAYRRLGFPDKAQPHLERALQLRRAVHGAESEPVAESLIDSAWSFFDKGQHEQAETHARQALTIYRRRGTSGQPMLSALLTLQRILHGSKQYSEMEQIMEAANLVIASSPDNTFAEFATITHTLADTRIEQSRYADAELLARRAVEMHRRLRASEHPQTAWALFTLGLALRSQQKLNEAEGSFQEALQIFSKYFSQDHKSIEFTKRELDGVLAAQGKPARASDAVAENTLVKTETLYRNELNRLKAELGSDHTNVATAMLNLAGAQRKSGKFQEAEPMAREAVAIRRKALGNEHLDLAHALSEFAFLLRQQNKHEEAEIAARENLSIRRKHFSNDHAEIAHALHILAWNINLRSKHAEAESLSREEAAIWRKALGSEHPNVAWALGDLAVFLRDQKKYAEAEEAIRESLSIRRKQLKPGHPDIIGSAKFLNELLRAQGKPAE